MNINDLNQKIDETKKTLAELELEAQAAIDGGKEIVAAFKKNPIDEYILAILAAIALAGVIFTMIKVPDLNLSVTSDLFRWVAKESAYLALSVSALWFVGGKSFDLISHMIEEKKYEALAILIGLWLHGFASVMTV